jgi:hypothetical protein
MKKWLKISITTILTGYVLYTIYPPIFSFVTYLHDTSQPPGISITYKVTTMNSETKQPQTTQYNPGSIGLVLQATRDLDAQLYHYENQDQTILWSSANESIVSVDGSGKIHGEGVGTTKVTASSLDGKANKAITVNVFKPVQSLTTEDTPMQLKVGESSMPPLIYNPSDVKLIWREYGADGKHAGKIKIATNGMLTGIAPGIVHFRITYGYSFTNPDLQAEQVREEDVLGTFDVAVIK